MKKSPFLLTAFLCLSTSFVFAQTPPSDTATRVETTVFEKVEVEARVDREAWRTHLQKQLLPYIESAAVRGMKAGNYTVNVRFLVEKDGSISDVRSLDDPGYGLALGAVRTVRTGPGWLAGEVGGRKVRSYHTQPITFQIIAK